jgi:hypothetical protein
MLALTFLLAAAWAGARPYAFVQGTESLPPTSLELESWFGFDRDRAGAGAWGWWFGPVAGLSDRVEGGLFAVFDQPATEVSAMSLSALWLQVSTLLAEPGAWPVDVRLRGEVAQPAAVDQHYAASVAALASRRQGPLDLTANGSVWLEFEDERTEPYLDLGLGTSWGLPGGARIGVESFSSSEFEEEGEIETAAYVGPAMAYGHGRFWLSLAWGGGVTEDSDLSRARLVLGLSH